MHSTTVAVDLAKMASGLPVADATVGSAPADPYCQVARFSNAADGVPW